MVAVRGGNGSAPRISGVLEPLRRPRARGTRPEPCPPSWPWCLEHSRTPRPGLPRPPATDRHASETAPVTSSRVPPCSLARARHRSFFPVFATNRFDALLAPSRLPPCVFHNSSELRRRRSARRATSAEHPAPEVGRYRVRARVAAARMSCDDADGRHRSAGF